MMQREDAALVVSKPKSKLQDDATPLDPTLKLLEVLFALKQKPQQAR